MARADGLMLALDTSSEMIGFALSDGERLLAEAIWRGQRQGTATLLAEVMRALEALGWTQDDLHVVAVATGPGSFSGLRVGISIAKGLALGLGIPIVGVSTHAITAEPFLMVGKPICPLVAAGRGRFAYAVYAEDGGTLRELTPMAHGTAAEIGALLATYPGVIACGELGGAAEAIASAAPGMIVPPVGVRTRRPGALADIAWRRILRGEADDLVALEPVYLHTSPAAGAVRSKG